MKSKLLMLTAVAALCLGGCATYTGGTADDSTTVGGTSYDGAWGPSYDYGAFPVYQQGSPNGQDMPMGARPDIIFYR